MGGGRVSEYNQKRDRISFNCCTVEVLSSHLQCKSSSMQKTGVAPCALVVHAKRGTYCSKKEFDF